MAPYSDNKIPLRNGLQYFHYFIPFYIYGKGSKCGLYQLLFVYWFCYHVNTFHPCKFYLFFQSLYL